MGVRRKSTIKELAERAGVSTATVSRVLNNSGYVSEETRRRVESTVAQSGYVPDANARQLRGKSSKLIGLVIPSVRNVFYTILAEAVEHTLRNEAYTMILGVTQEDPKLFLEYLESFRQRGVDGVLYVAPAHGSLTREIRRLALQGLPMVEVNRRQVEELLDGVVADNFHGAFQATEYLIQLGHRRIGLVVGSQETITGRDRVQGYESAMRGAGIDIEPELVKIGEFAKDHAIEATKELLRLKIPPTAIFAASNRLVLGTMAALMDNDVRVPADISVIGFDDVEWLQYFNPPITTVDIAVDRMATLSVELLMRRVREGVLPERPRTYSLSTMLIERRSCRRLTPEEGNPDTDAPGSGRPHGRLTQEVGSR